MHFPFSDCFFDEEEKLPEIITSTMLKEEQRSEELSVKEMEKLRKKYEVCINQEFSLVLIHRFIYMCGKFDVSRI